MRFTVARCSVLPMPPTAAAPKTSSNSVAPAPGDEYRNCPHCDFEQWIGYPTCQKCRGDMAARPKKTRVSKTQRVGCAVGSVVAIILYQFVGPALFPVAEDIVNPRAIGAGLFGAVGCGFGTIIARRIEQRRTTSKR